MLNFLVQCTLPLAYWEQQLNNKVAKLTHSSNTGRAALNCHLVTNKMTNYKMHHFNQRLVSNRYNEQVVQTLTALIGICTNN